MKRAIFVLMVPALVSLASSSPRTRVADLHVGGSQVVRDLWRQKDLGVFADRFTAAVPAHGTVLVKIGRPRGRP
jgi:hypothetical protein